MPTATSQDLALDRFRREIDPARADIDLGQAFLALGAFEYPRATPAGYLPMLDTLAGRAVARFGTQPIDPLELAGFLFRDEAFTGNTSDPGDPRNSFLNQVLERRVGIPITLSVVYLEVARRLGLSAVGIGLPGHFIVRASGAGDTEPVFIDPFNRGVPMSLADCAERVRSITGGRLPFNPAFLEPVGPRYILTRILNNLKSAYAARNDGRRAICVVERLIALNSNDAAEWRNLGLLLAGQKQRRRAVEAFERYIALAPPSEDTKAAHELASNLAGQIARMN